jgi:hypothetical protein
MKCSALAVFLPVLHSSYLSLCHVFIVKKKSPCFHAIAVSTGVTTTGSAQK